MWPSPLILILKLPANYSGTDWVSAAYNNPGHL